MTCLPEKLRFYVGKKSMLEACVSIPLSWKVESLFNTVQKTKGNVASKGIATRTCD